MAEELAVEIDNEEQLADAIEDDAETGYETEDAEPQEQEAEQELVVTIDGEAPAPEAQETDLVRHLRKTIREKEKRAKELEAQLNATKPKAVTPTLGPMPTMDDTDVDWDPDKLARKMAVWVEEKRKVEAHQQDVERQQQEAQSEWQTRLERYGQRKTELKVKDFDDAEAAVLETLDQTQQGVILQGSEDSALLVYALGKNPKKAQELAAIKDPVKFAFAAAKLEAKMSVSTGRKAPPPEKALKGAGAISGTVDSTLERLRAEAEKTGDMSKVLAYKRQQRGKT